MENTTYNHLNEYIQVFIRLDGMDYVVANYIDIRDQYYCQKPA